MATITKWRVSIKHDKISISRWLKAYINVIWISKHDEMRRLVIMKEKAIVTKPWAKYHAGRGIRMKSINNDKNSDGEASVTL